MSTPPADTADLTLRQFLRQQHGMGSADMRKAMEAGRVRLHGVPTAAGGRTVDPAAVTLLDERAPRLVPGRDLVLIHSDAELAVIWKPAGLLSVPARSHPEGHRSAEGLLRRLLGTVHTVHRIDQDTSGLLVFARTAAARDHLKEQLEARTVTRSYLALVAGNPGPAPRRIDLPLVRDRGDGRRGARPHDKAPPDALAAVTHIEAVTPLDARTSLVRARLESGRTHQLRLHAEAIRSPLLGDSLYARATVARAAPRLALYAATLGFVHPASGETLQFETALPDDLEQLRRTILRAASAPPPGAKRTGPRKTGGPKKKGGQKKGGPKKAGRKKNRSR